jgi:hypothetical protein
MITRWRQRPSCQEPRPEAHPLDHRNRCVAKGDPLTRNSPRGNQLTRTTSLLESARTLAVHHRWIPTPVNRTHRAWLAAASPSPT